MTPGNDLDAGLDAGLDTHRYTATIVRPGDKLVIGLHRDHLTAAEGCVLPRIGLLAGPALAWAILRWTRR